MEGSKQGQSEGGRDAWWAQVNIYEITDDPGLWETERETDMWDFGFGGVDKGVVSHGVPVVEGGCLFGVNH